MRDPRRSAGYAGLWVLVIFSLLAIAAVLAVAAQDDRMSVPIPFVAFASLLVAGGLAIEARYDPLEFCQMTSLLSALVALTLGYVALGDPGSLSAASLGAAVAALVSAGCVVRWVQLRGRREVLHDVLQEHFDRGSIVEIDGVQFVGVPSHVEVAAGDELTFTVHAQNAFDAPRTLLVQLSPDRRRLSGPALEADKEARLELPPGAAGVLQIPIAVHPGASGRFDVHFEPRVEGAGGTRVRFFRGQPFRHRQHPVLFAFFFVFGLLFALLGNPTVLALGRGGTRFHLNVQKRPERHDQPFEGAPPAEASTVYEPERHELAQPTLSPGG